jgi:hypothetical protein
MPNAYYSASLDTFLADSPDAILGVLARNSEGDVEQSQLGAWRQEIDLLKRSLVALQGTIHLEYVVPRIGSRIDAAIVVGSVVFVIEFKVGAKNYFQADLNQAWDYALDLKNFHSASHQLTIIPILVATEAAYSDKAFGVPHADGVLPPASSNGAGLRPLMQIGLAASQAIALDGMAWARSPYRPTPTIIEAAQALFAGHAVAAIASHEAGSRDLAITTGRVEAVIDQARADRRKAIVFVTGVPGAGKTLVGLNIATKRRDLKSLTHAVFLSGNGPLVAVLREALTLDGLVSRRKLDPKARKGDVAQEVKAFIQNVHHFRDEGLVQEGAPSDHVVIFDEAQRAWDRDMTTDFMLRKKGRPEFDQSEPQFLLSCMDRHADWAAVVCLVGGGQEINRGEAGIAAWLEAVRDQFPDWRVYISPELVDSEYAAGHAIETLDGKVNLTEDPDLHLAVSVRSFRAENVSRFVKAVLDCDRTTARRVLEPMLERYPIAVTRSLKVAKRWVRQQARGTERTGVVASSGAQRLKPHAIDIRFSVNPVHWFLKEADDTRSSYYLEDAATEFQVQGLELDWTCVAWDADLRFVKEGWQYRSFRGSKWDEVRKQDRRQYLLNAYRVLLTRARQGMVLFVPEGDAADPTRDPAFYDGTFEYLTDIGVPVV